MGGLSFFGLFAVSAMLLFYALEHCSRWFILAFAGACALGARSVAVRSCGSDLVRCGRASMVVDELISRNRKRSAAASRKEG
jgi:hypothetical protein